MTTVVFIVNGTFESAMGHRARAIASHLNGRYRIEVAYREGNRTAALVRFLTFLMRVRPQAVYVFDMAYSGVLSAWLYRSIFLGRRMIVDTGDAIYELMRSTGNRGRLGLWMTRSFERFSLRAADRVVVRGRLHRRLLTQAGIEAEVIQDGVDTRQFAPQGVDDLRREHGLDGVLTIGLVGSSVWSEKLGMCYGWELVEALRLLKNSPVKGVVIGDGSGIPRLKARCREYGIEDQVLFLGRVPYDELPRYLNLIDICLSTQTNDVVGQVRTSGKLPLYLAAGRYVLASEVGEAAFVLDKEMLVAYEGVVDGQYPQKLVERIQAILRRPEMLGRAAANVAVAKELFDYSRLAERVGRVLEAVVRSERRVTPS